jgi:DNA ligase (NAD+)
LSKGDRVKALERLIRKYQDSYYNGEAEISDAEFDLLWDELKSLDPGNGILKKVGADGQAAGQDGGGADGFPKAKHLIPMGSQDKAANPEEFRAWAEKIHPAVWVVQYKLDGASLELQYKKGTLAAAVTRGDGTVGDEITANALKMKGVVRDLGNGFSGGIRGEVVMTRDVWKKKYQDKANCRNAANGIMRRKDGAGCEDLLLVTYDAAAPGNDTYFADEMQKIRWLQSLGFTTAETREFGDPEDIIAYRADVADKRKKLGMDIDGLVVKDKVTDMADLRRPRPERQIAFKFELETAFSVLRGVEWSESGATYTPIGIVDPVRLAGTTVQRANLNNPDMIRAMGLKIGAAVSVVKRGEIIPKIEALAPEGAMEGAVPAEETEIEFPRTCGTCGAELVDAGTRLYCPNAACPKRLLHRLEKWVKVLGIMEIGEKLLGQLFEKGRVRQPGDLYTLESEELASFDRMGELSAVKVVRHIRARRELSLAAFVAGFDFEGVGELIMEKVTAAGMDTLEKLRSATVEEIAGVYGLGEITAKTIADGLRECEAEMDRVLGFGVISIAPPPASDSVPLKGYSFCFTGELTSMKRGEAEEKIRTLGGTVKSSIVKDLSFLVTNDPESGSGKNKKARGWGIPVIGEDEFLALLEKHKLKN